VDGLCVLTGNLIFKLLITVKHLLPSMVFDKVLFAG